jgi:hypothetical protein
MSLIELYNTLANQHGSKTEEMIFTFSDKGSMHSYIEFYEQYFEPRREHVSLLEIGIMTGGSMHLWQRYFKKYQLVGIDLSPSWNQLRNFQAEVENDPNITLLFEINSRNKQIPEEVKSMSFDFIIDDGDHSVLAQMDTFENYWPVLADQGTYFIEDVVGVTQAEALKNFLTEYSNKHQQVLKIDHYQGLKNGRADDQILAISKEKNL